MLTNENLKTIRTNTYIAAATAFVYYLSNPKPNTYYNYTFRVAENLLGGGVAFAEKPPPWLNEFVPFEDVWYSVFPFGAVVSMLPFAFLKIVGLITQMPSAFIAAMCAGVSCVFLLLIAKSYEISKTRVVVMTLGILFGTWAWTNVTMGGAWQLALGFALVGVLGAIYFAIYNQKPLVAGIFFALAFGNRTEILLTAPIFIYLLWRNKSAPRAITTEEIAGSLKDRAQPTAIDNKLVYFRVISWIKERFQPLKNTKIHKTNQNPGYFCFVPFLLGISTLVYNYVRFHSFTDFGYTRIPGVLAEPWYNHGIFSVYYIPRQMWEMLLKLWEFRSEFFLPMPNPFSSSILISSPFLLFAFRRRRNKTSSGIDDAEARASARAKSETQGHERRPPFAVGRPEIRPRDRTLIYLSWAAVAVICIVLWMHGNSGGWQFGYRYAVVILPFLFVIMLENAPKRISPLEWAAYGLSFAANTYATWLFHWTEYLKP
ncbi:MAG: hypothetical protein ACRD6X_14230 [Pyrinomonadaceae bacterium]